MVKNAIDSHLQAVLNFNGSLTFNINRGGSAQVSKRGVGMIKKAVLAVALMFVGATSAGAISYKVDITDIGGDQIQATFFSPELDFVYQGLLTAFFWNGDNVKLIDFQSHPDVGPVNPPAIPAPDAQGPDSEVLFDSFAPGGVKSGSGLAVLTFDVVTMGDNGIGARVGETSATFGYTLLPVTILTPATPLLQTNKVGENIANEVLRSGTMDIALANAVLRGEQPVEALTTVIPVPAPVLLLLSGIGLLGLMGRRHSALA